MTAVATCIVYLLSTIELARGVKTGITARQSAASVRSALLLGGFAVLLHAAVHLQSWLRNGDIDFRFFTALSLAGLGVALLTTLVAWFRPIHSLGIIVYPVAAFSLLLYMVGGKNEASGAIRDWRIELHAFLALLAYATLSVAALLALMLWFQERALRRHHLSLLLRTFPPLTQLEALLFHVIESGSVLLTLALVTGVLFVDNLFAQHLVHKTVLSLLAWLVFGALLVGRHIRGWRGQRAVRLVLIAMFLLLLAFFGSKFVLEMVLHRT